MPFIEDTPQDKPARAILALNNDVQSKHEGHAPEQVPPESWAAQRRMAKAQGLQAGLVNRNRLSDPDTLGGRGGCVVMHILTLWSE